VKAAFVTLKVASTVASINSTLVELSIKGTEAAAATEAMTVVEAQAIFTQTALHGDATKGSRRWASAGA